MAGKEKRDTFEDDEAEDLMDCTSQERPAAMTEPIIKESECGRDRARRRWVTVEFIVILVAASYGGMATLSGQYIRQRVSLDLYGNTTQSNGSQCNQGNATMEIEEEIQKITSKWTLYLCTCAALPSIFSTLIIGSLSERYGRRMPILLPCIGFLGQCVGQLCVVYLCLPLSYLLFVNVFCGLCGGMSLFMAGCFAYITDITTEKQRMVRIVIVEILAFAGIGAMQIGLGYMIKSLGFGLSLWMPFTAMVLSLINAGIPWLLIETIVPKSKEERRDLAEVLRDIINLFRVKTDNRLYLLLSMFAMTLLVGIVIQGGIPITMLYGQGQPFCWDSVTIGFYITTSLAIPGIGTVSGAGIFQWCKLGYLWIIQISILSCLANTLALAFTYVIQSTIFIFASSFLGLFRLLGVPVIRTFLSAVVQEHEHGALFALLGVLDGLCSFLALPIVNGVYYSTIDVLSTAVFFFMSALLFISIIITGALQCRGFGRENRNRPLSVHADINDETGLLPPENDQ
ncbi:proton-coupled folate transporter isoform X2 [Strongylocentrotus purpuratus]|uniref:Proton-coupled folate transporter n=1 Tax=Strongylocentrotus purpuratus TaxID=7668 RepID=A0A7M7NMA2_STRPU|nr:proton-coupled folate transporter isoform X2 [Strongylocentrotus purpuratus]XP_030838749.1 proton-coupled folate transporter isoform X2 [Strongylocentrotus purpuratus]XP_030838750.1 proton-coupled folate transporter isoform X2 [Strongylocentrotus purpuratus]XP_030838751.1 proton-coupled folate transporter isoform X2 [Strongylocentrotus purpuratus]XP_030838752.1 proton-coupled folate transporter isoform X2 [Strongylocentrotus purpuratus]